MEGRVEVCRSGVWGAVYDYGGWNFNDVKVICRQLGYPSECEFYVASMPIYSLYLLCQKFSLICKGVILVMVLMQID